MPTPTQLDDAPATTPSRPKGIREILARGRARFNERIPGTMGDIEEACRTLASGAGDPETFANLRLLVHTLAGSGATFGFARLADAALDFEDFLARLRGPMTAERAGRLAEYLGGLRRAVAESTIDEIAVRLAEDPARSRGA